MSRPGPAPVEPPLPRHTVPMHERRLLAAVLLATALGGLHHAIVGPLSPRLITDLDDPDRYSLLGGGYLVASADVRQSG